MRSGKRNGADMDTLKSPVVTTSKPLNHRRVKVPVLATTIEESPSALTTTKGGAYANMTTMKALKMHKKRADK